MAKATHLRQINQRKVIRAMIRLRAASRTQLAREAELSQPTVGRIVDELLDRSILGEVEARDQATVPPLEAGQNGQQQPSQLGRPSQALQLDRRKKRFLAIQVGVHQTRVAATPIAVSEADEWQAIVPTPQSPRALADLMQRVVKPLVPARGLQACVVCLPGVVDQRAGRVLLSPNLHWTEKANFTEIVSAVTSARVLFLQEIRALALGQLAAEPELADFLLVDFGSGVGAAAVIGGKLYEAPLPLSGELGHTPVVGNDRPCSCGAVGCVETLVSRGGLLASARENGWPDDWAALVERLNAEGLPPWMTSSLDALATTIAGGVNVLGLRQVLISGALNDLPAAIDHLSAAIRRGAMWGRFGDLDCRAIQRRRLLGMISLAIDEVLLPDDV